jgi:hypothetical protein
MRSGVNWTREKRSARQAAKARGSLEEDVPLGEQRHQEQVQHLVLPDHRLVNLGA